MKLQKKQDKHIESKKEKKRKEIKDLNINDKKGKNKKEKDANIFNLKEIIIIVIVTCCIASLCTGCVMYFKFRSLNRVSYYNLNDDSSLSHFIDVYADVVKGYYEDIDREAMVNAALQGMLNHLGDTYTTYLSEEDAKELTDKLSGKYEGIGIQITGNIIYSVFDDSPAEKAGLQVGDVITSINGKEITEENFNEITETIKEEDGDTFHIVVIRNEEKLEFDVKRTTLDMPAISYAMVEDGKSKIGYIYIETFSNTVANQVSKALKDLEEEGMESLIIDLRGNTGGYLTAATDVSSLFLEEGKVIYSLETKNKTKEYKDKTSEKRDYPIVVLINGGSASSSEIVAAALKDSYGAILVGTKSYGKGKVQSTKSYDDGSMSKYTTSRWLRPTGECIDGDGLHPDYEIELDISEDGTTMQDTQLEKAISILS